MTESEPKLTDDQRARIDVIRAKYRPDDPISVPLDDLNPVDQQAVIAIATEDKSREKSRSASKRRANPLAAKLTALNRFVDRSARTVSPVAALVWLVLFRDERDGEVKTGVTDLARRCGVSVRTVKRSLSELRKGELLEVVRAGGLRVGPNVYRLHPEGPDDPVA